MSTTFAIVLLLTFPGVSLSAQPAPDAPVVAAAESLKRRDLPDGFPYQMLNEGFAVVYVQIRNTGKETWSLDIETVETRDDRNKNLKTALLTEITPKIVKYYKGSQKGGQGELYVGDRRPLPGQRWERAPTISMGTSSRTLSVNTAQRIAEVLEAHQLKSAVLEPGQQLDGFIYVRSKKAGGGLKGQVVLTSMSIPF